MARPQKCRCICSKPKHSCFVPSDGAKDGDCIILGYDEYEVLRLLDYVRLSQEKCSVKMNISRTTVTRIYDNARAKIADALVNGKKLIIDGGDVVVCEKMKPECANEKFCCHRNNIKNTIIDGGK